MTGMPSTHRTSSRNMTKTACLIGYVVATLPKSLSRGIQYMAVTLPTQPVQKHRLYGCNIANTACLKT